MTQKDAVFTAVTTVLASNGISFQVNMTNVFPVLTRALRSQVNDYLQTEFLAGNVDISDDAKPKLADVVALRAYISGLVSNWVRKDTRLNGGTVVATTSASSSNVRSVRNDAQLKAMRVLLSSQDDPIKQGEIQAFIDKRVAELNSKR